jgi:hypothetical protein
VGLTIAESRRRTMITNALFAAAVVNLAFVFLLAPRLRFLSPYRHLIFQHLLASLLLALALSFLNLTAFFFSLARKFFLKDTGRKLAHFDRDLNAGRTPMPPHLHREELN